MHAIVPRLARDPQRTSKQRCCLPHVLPFSALPAELKYVHCPQPWLLGKRYTSEPPLRTVPCVLWISALDGILHRTSKHCSCARHATHARTHSRHRDWSLAQAGAQAQSQTRASQPARRRIGRPRSRYIHANIAGAGAAPSGRRQRQRRHYANTAGLYAHSEGSHCLPLLAALGNDELQKAVVRLQCRTDEALSLQQVLSCTFKR